MHIVRDKRRIKETEIRIVVFDFFRMELRRIFRIRQPPQTLPATLIWSIETLHIPELVGGDPCDVKVECAYDNHCFF